MQARNRPSRILIPDGRKGRHPQCFRFADSRQNIHIDRRVVVVMAVIPTQMLSDKDQVITGTELRVIITCDSKCNRATLIFKHQALTGGLAGQPCRLQRCVTDPVDAVFLNINSEPLVFDAESIRCADEQHREHRQTSQIFRWSRHSRAKTSESFEKCDREHGASELGETNGNSSWR